MELKKRMNLLGKIERNLIELTKKTEVKSLTYPIYQEMLIKIRGLMHPHVNWFKSILEDENENKQA